MVRWPGRGHLFLCNFSANELGAIRDWVENFTLPLCWDVIGWSVGFFLFLA